MHRQSQYSAEVSQDNYGRWFVQARHGQRRLAPIRCLSEREARDLAERLEGSAGYRSAA